MRLALHIEHFMDRVSMEPNSGCWLWLGPLDKDGYATGGRGRLSRRRNRRAWELFRGPIPHELCVLHSCDNPPCVNPGHLFLGTQADNQRDRHAKDRYATGVDHHWHRSRSPIPSGEKHPKAKLSDAQVAAIRAEWVDRYGEQTRLARKYGVTQSEIFLIVRRNHRSPRSAAGARNG